MKSYLTYALIAVACVAVFAAGHFSGLYGWKATRSDSRELFTQNALAFSLSGVMEIGRTSPENWKNLAAYDDPEWARAHMPEINWVPGVALAPLIGASPAPGNYGTATISPDQFRYAKPIVKPKPEGTFRLFLVGGSTAYGSGATSNAATIGGYLEFILGTVAPRRKIEVITAAYPAWGSSQELAALLFRIMSQYAPDMVISFSGFNDCYWSISGRNTLFSRTFGDGFIDNVWRLSHKLAAAGAPVEIVPRSLDGPVAPAVAAKRLVRNVDLMAYAIQRQGGVFYFVLQPSIFWTKKQLSPNEKKYSRADIDYYAQCRADTLEGLQGVAHRNFKYFDSSGIFDALDEKTDIFMDRVHFGQRGNRIIAEYLARIVKPSLRQPAPGR